MEKLILALGALAGSAGIASAGAIDRGTQSTAVIFETGNHVELTFGYLSPSVTGTEVTIPGSPTFNGSSSGEMYRDYITGSIAIKTQIQPGWMRPSSSTDPSGPTPPIRWARVMSRQAPRPAWTARPIPRC